jgi:hypothetical protein
MSHRFIFLKKWPAKLTILVTLIMTSLLLTLLTPSYAANNTELTPQKTIRWQDFLGVNAHFLWFKPDVYQQQVTQLKKLGLNWVRVDLHWDRHESSKGQYRLEMVDPLIQTLKTEQLNSVFYLVGSAPFASSAPKNAKGRDQYPPKNNQDFADSIGMLAKRYPEVSAWQVWNEPNLPSYWRPKENAEGYAKLFQASNQKLKQVVPDKPVVMAGMAYYSQMPYQKNALMLEALGKMGVFGLGAVVAYHPYTEFPEGNSSKDQDYLLHVEQLNPRLRGAGVKNIWATEWGWSSYAGPIEMQALIGQNGQADFLLRRLALMSTQDFDRIFLFALSDLDSRASARDRGYGLLTEDAKPKPAYLALQRFLNIMGPEISPAKPLAIVAKNNGLYSVTWKNPQHKLWLSWASSAMTVTVPSNQSAVLHDPLTGSKQTLTPSQGKLLVPVKTTLQILEL